MELLTIYYTWNHLTVCENKWLLLNWNISILNYNTSNHLTVYENKWLLLNWNISILNYNTWNHLNVYENKWLLLNWNISILNYNTWNHLTVCQQMSYGSLKKLSTNYSFTNHRYIIRMYKQDLALNTPEWLICYKHNTTNQPFSCTSCHIKAKELVVPYYLLLMLNIEGRMIMMDPNEDGEWQDTSCISMYRDAHSLTRYCLVGVNFDWVIDFNGMSTHLGLFYTKSLRNSIHCKLIFSFFE